VFTCMCVVSTFFELFVTTALVILQYISYLFMISNKKYKHTVE